MVTFSADTFNAVLNGLTLILGGGILGVFLKHRHGMRSLKLQDDADVRDHDDGLLGRYSEELDRVIGRQRECEAREEALRQRVMELENDVLGLIRIITQASADKVLMLGEEASETIHSMALRIKRHREGRGNQ
jgi:hypothetical protein